MPLERGIETGELCAKSVLVEVEVLAHAFGKRTPECSWRECCQIEPRVYIHIAELTRDIEDVRITIMICKIRIDQRIVGFAMRSKLLDIPTPVPRFNCPK